MPEGRPARTPSHRRRSRAAFALWTIALGIIGMTAPAASAQSAAPQPPPPDKPDQRPTGLPPRIAWTFNFDAGWGTFGFANSYYNNPKGSVPEDLSDQWFEGYVKPALSGKASLASAGELYGKVSVVGERTYGSAPGLYGPDVSSFGADEAVVGWRSGASAGRWENLLDVSVGRAIYQLGHGMLLYDGAAEGGSRGGYWTNARKAFEFAAIARVKPGPHTVELFYLDKDELPESETGTRLWGLNYEAALPGDSTIGVTYLRLTAHPDIDRARDGLSVLNVRGYGSPLPRLPGLSVETEFAAERNGGLRQSNAWTVTAAYELASAPWTPKLSYRYAMFEGDDPDTSANEAFDPLLPGFHDWGSWWQGEIAGEYFLSNSNLISHHVRAHVAPGESVEGGVILYDFRLHRRSRAISASLADRRLAVEADLYVDWTVNDNVTISVVGAFADPRAAVTQVTRRTKPFTYGMAYVAYSF